MQSKKPVFKPPLEMPYLGPIINNNVNKERYEELYSIFQTNDYENLLNEEYNNIDLSFKTSNGTIINAIINNPNLSQEEIILLFKKFKNFSNLTMNTKNDRKDNPLHIACKKQYFDVIKYLLDNGYGRNIEKQYDSLGNLPIHYLVQNLTYDCKENDFYEKENYEKNKNFKIHKKEIDFEKILISSINDFYKDSNEKKNLLINFEKLIELNKFYKIEEFMDVINEAKGKIEKIFEENKIPMNESNIEEIENNPNYIEILNNTYKNLLNLYEKYKIDLITYDNKDEIIYNLKNSFNNDNQKKNYENIKNFNETKKKLLEKGETFKENYFDDALSLYLVYKFIYITIDTEFVDILNNLPENKKVNIIKIAEDLKNKIDGNNNNAEDKKIKSIINIIYIYIYQYVPTFNILPLDNKMRENNETIVEYITNFLRNNSNKKYNVKINDDDLENYDLISSYEFNDDNDNNVQWTDEKKLEVAIALLKYLEENDKNVFNDINYAFMFQYFNIFNWENINDKNNRKCAEINKTSIYYENNKELFDNYCEIKDKIAEALKNMYDNNETNFDYDNNVSIYNKYENIINGEDELKYYLNKTYPQFILNPKEKKNLETIPIFENKKNKKNKIYLKNIVEEKINKNNVEVLNSNENLNETNDEMKDNLIFYSKLIDYDYFDSKIFKYLRYTFTTGINIKKKIDKLLNKNISTDYVQFCAFDCLDIYYELLDVVKSLMNEYSKFVKYEDQNNIENIKNNFDTIKNLLSKNFTKYNKLMNIQIKYVNNLVNNYKEKSLKNNFNNLYKNCVNCIDKVDEIIISYNKSISFLFLENYIKGEYIENFSTNKFQLLKKKILKGNNFFKEIYNEYYLKTVYINKSFIEDNLVILKDINYNELYFTDSNEKYKNFINDNKFVCGYLYVDLIKKKVEFTENINVNDANSKISFLSNKIIYDYNKNEIYAKKFNNLENIDKTKYIEPGKYIFKQENYETKSSLDKIDPNANYPIISIEYVQLILIYLVKHFKIKKDEIKQKYKDKTNQDNYKLFEKYAEFIDDKNIFKSILTYYNYILYKMIFKEIKNIIKDYVLINETLKNSFQSKLNLDKGIYDEYIKENIIKLDKIYNNKATNNKLIHNKCYKKDQLFEIQNILKQMNLFDKTEQGLTIMNILINQMNYKAIKYLVNNEMNLTFNEGNIKNIKDVNNLTPYQYAFNKLKIIVNKYKENGEEINDLNSFQSKVIENINSDEKFQIGLKKDNTIENIIKNNLYIFNDFIWLKIVNKESIFKKILNDEEFKNILIENFDTNEKKQLLNTTLTIDNLTDEEIDDDLKTYTKNELYEKLSVEQKNKILDFFDKKILLKTLNAEQINNYINKNNLTNDEEKNKLINNMNNIKSEELVKNNEILYNDYNKLIKDIYQQYVIILEIVNSNNIITGGKINNYIFEHFDDMINNHFEILIDYFNDINKKICESYYDLDKTINDTYNYTNDNMIKIIKLNIINIYSFEFNEIIKYYLKETNNIEYEKDNIELLINMFFENVVMELGLYNPDEETNNFETLKEIFINKLFSDIDLKRDENENLYNFLNTTMEFYKTIIVKLSKYYKKKVENYINDLQSISILLNIMFELK